MSCEKELKLEEKRSKIRSNYETIDVLRARLEENKARQATGMSRAAYIKMIFEVTRKVERQNEELAKAVQDIRRHQRDINNLSGRLERSFSAVKEGILKDVKGEQVAGRDCYRLLGVMHESFDELLKAIQETGELNRQIRQLEDEIGQLRACQKLAFGPVDVYS